MHLFKSIIVHLIFKMYNFFRHNKSTLLCGRISTVSEQKRIESRVNTELKKYLKWGTHVHNFLCIQTGFSHFCSHANNTNEHPHPPVRQKKGN